MQQYRIIEREMEVNESLIAILKKSHSQAMSGQTVSMDEVERFMNEKVYELTHQVDAYCAAESV